MVLISLFKFNDREASFNIYVFRHTSVTPAHAEGFKAAAAKLAGKTIYRAHPANEDAPQITDCLTAVHYLFKETLKTDIPLTWIGDMPRQLASFGEWRVLSIERKDAQLGDLIFTKNKIRPKLLSHVGMIFGPDRVFHCCRNLKTARIEFDEDFFSVYEQHLSLDKALRYIDPRNSALRKEHQGLFLRNPRAISDEETTLKSASGRVFSFGERR